MTYRRKDVWLTGFAAFVAWGLAVQQLPVLRYLGYAFNLGLFTAVAGLIFLIISTSRTLAARATVDDYLKAAIVSPTNWGKEKTIYLTAQKYKAKQILADSLPVSQAIDVVLTTALQDLISSWYTNISKSPAFVQEVDRNIRIALIEITNRLRDEDLVTVLVSRIIPVITAHFRHFELAEKTVRGRILTRDITESEELDLAIASKYRDGNLHPAASLSYSDTTIVQQEHLRKLLVRILPDVVADSMIRSRGVSVLVKEIVACAVLSPVVRTLSEPDTWNQIIEAYGRTALQDRKSVKLMRAALDEHASPSAKKQSAQTLPRLVPNDSERSFERFVRAIRKTKTLSDARRYRSQISSQLAKESTADGQDPTYIRRLEMAKRVLDQKIARMTNTGTISVPQHIQQESHDSRARARERTLPEIMHTSSGLSYFMEYMDRQKRMSLVQFWIVVDGFRNPLEDDFGDESSTATHSTWTDNDRLDIAQISETYISRPEIHVPAEAQESVRIFLVAGRKATTEQYRAARTAILSTQSAVLEELESQHLPQFRKSDLYYKFLASDEANSKGFRVNEEADHSIPSKERQRSQTPPAVRSSSQPAARARDLRRAALSSTDVRKGLDSAQRHRRSEDAGERTPLFDDGYDTDPLAHSSYSIGHESVNGDDNHQDEVIESMEAALTDIMAESPQKYEADDGSDALFEPVVETKKSGESGTPSQLFSDTTTVDLIGPDKPRPSLATLGLVNTSSRIGVFSDNDLFGDEERFPEDEYADQDPDEHTPAEDEIHAAAPGDLGLTEAITVLSTDIERLVSQESVVDALTRKAELTNNVAELRILGKSKASLQREIRRKELQRQQYIVQESDNSLFGRSSIRIKSVMVGREEDGREFAMYVIEVQRQAGDQIAAATWAIARRYSEFHDLYQQLRRRYPSTRGLDFPRRRMVMKLQKQFLQGRKLALETYLRELLRMPDVCRSRELRSFLSQRAILSNQQTSGTSDTQDLVSRIYNSVTDGMDDFLGNIAVLDQLSVAGQNLISAATGQMAVTSQSDVVSIEPGSIAEAEAEIRAFEDKELEPFVKPICDIFLEIFDLNKGNNWLRGRAVVVVLHQLLGGTVERKIRDIFKLFFSEDSLLKYIEQVKEMVWPANLGGKRQEFLPRTTAQKFETRRQADVMLASLIPDLAGSVVGRSNAQSAAKKIMATLNNKRLNEHLVMTILDEIIIVLFGKPKAGTRSN